MIDDTGKSVTISVKAVFAEHNDPNVYKDIIINGSASITTRNGISVTVTCGAEAFEPGTRLAVHEITAEEKEAYDWFSHVMEGTGTDILPFDISFEKNGQSIPLNSKIQIDITLPGGYTAPVVCYITTDGRVQVLSSIIKDGKISFETDHTSYYAVADGIKDPGDSSQKGDYTNLLVYGLLSLSATVILVTITVRYKKQVKRR